MFLVNYRRNSFSVGLLLCNSTVCSSTFYSKCRSNHSIHIYIHEYYFIPIFFVHTHTTRHTFLFTNSFAPSFFLSSPLRGLIVAYVTVKKKKEREREEERTVEACFISEACLARSAIYADTHSAYFHSTHAYYSPFSTLYYSSTSILSCDTSVFLSERRVS